MADLNAAELLRQGRKQELWQRCCGFIDLSIREFMEIQHRLLKEQLELLSRCPLGGKLLRGTHPETTDDFRRLIPLTTYNDYAPYLPEKIESALPNPPITWQRTSGRSNFFTYKWVPISQALAKEMMPTFLAILLFATARNRGDVNLKEYERFLYLLAPPPYASGSWARWGAQEFPFDFMPPLDEAEAMPFETRVQKGFELAIKNGMDILFGISSILVAVGQRFSGQNQQKVNIASLLLKPKIITRLGGAMVKSKLHRRNMLPRDIWSLKGLIAGGTDTAVYREKIKEMWGRYPLNMYGSTECLIIAMQTWDYQGMTFVPYFSLLEFIPMSERQKAKANPGYQPQTLLLDEVKAGENYEVVCTNFHGGPFVRYRLGDIVSITSLRNETLNIDIPQMAFYSRADDVLDFTYTSFTERSIWQAIENSGIKYIDWVARKEIQTNAILHLYIETEPGGQDNEAQCTELLDQQFKSLQEDYAHLEKDFGMKPVKVTLLPPGAFQHYLERQRAAGAELGHLKPPHINPPDRIIASLLEGATQ